MNIKFKREEIKKRYGGNVDIPPINSVSALNNPKSNSLIFCIKYKDEYLELLSSVSESVILIDKQAEIPIEISKFNCVIKVINPRLEYVYILNNFVISKKSSYSSNSYYIDPSSIVDETCIIEPFVFIEKNVKIGKFCHLKSGARICSNTIIGDNCVIGSNSVVGDQGFGIERDNKEEWQRVPFDGKPMKMPHYGGVVICDYVEIGALNTVVSGAIEPTIIGDYVKTDDHVHIAHNCKIDSGVLITAAAELSGGVSVGKNSWIGPNASIFQQNKIGKKCLIGIGANVFKDVEDGEVYMGLPAKKIIKDNK